MITVISLNPSIDRTLSVEALIPGSTNRAHHSRADAGGKGINVCLHLAALGNCEVQCVGLMRSADAELFNFVLHKAGVRTKWLTLPGNVRTNTKVIASDGMLTEINESGTALTPDEAEALLALCADAISGSSVVVLTGSIPPGMPAEIYGKLIHIAHTCGARVILDADGTALRSGIQAQPDFIKPNQAELERLASKLLPDTESLISAVHDLMAINLSSGCVSLGAMGALFFSREGIFSLPALQVPVRSTVGAGDAMTAVFALGMDSNMPFEEICRLSIAASAAAVSSEGTQGIDADAVALLHSRVPMPNPLDC